MADSVATAAIGTEDPASPQDRMARSWIALPAIILPVVLLIAASGSIGFARIAAPPSTIQQLLEALLPGVTNPTTSHGWTLLRPLIELEKSRALTPTGASLLAALILQATACAVTFAGAALRSTNLIGMVAALALGCNPAWLALLKQGPGAAAGLTAALLVMTFTGTIRRLPARPVGVTAVAGLALLAIVVWSLREGAAEPPALLLLIGGSLGPLLGVLALTSGQNRPWGGGILTAGPLALSLLAFLLATTVPPRHRQIEENQAKLAAQSAFQELLRPFVRRAERVIVWDQSVRVPQPGRVTVLPRRFDISRHELSYALRHGSARILMVIACEEPSDCSAAQLEIDAVNFATVVVLNGGRLPIHGKDLYYTAVEHLPANRP